MSVLRIARNLELPVKVLMERMTILGMSGAGKTNTATVIVEEMLKQHLPVAVIDPKGDFWGLQSSADGKREGFPILVMGGEHKDVPLEPTAGVVVADLIVDRDVSVVIDLQDMSKGKAKRFVTDFLEQLYHRRRKPMHLIVDEADLFCPQKLSDRDDARMLGAVQDIVARGRKRGIGSTLVTQRAARLNKDALTQSQVLIAHGMSGKPDKDQVAEWMDEFGIKPDPVVLREVGKLDTGHAFVWSPRLMKIVTPKHVVVRERETFDSSATPEIGKAVRQPKRLAKMDLERLTEAVKATVEKAKADDPSNLRTRIASLEAELKAAKAKPFLGVTVGPKGVEKVERIKTKTVEVQVIGERELRRIEKAARVIAQNTMDVRSFAASIELAVEKVGKTHAEYVAKNRASVGLPPKPAPVAPTAYRPQQKSVTPPDGSYRPTGAQRPMLAAVLAHGPMTRRDLGIAAWIQHTSGTFSDYLSLLRREGAVVDSDGLVAPGPRAMELGVTPRFDLVEIRAGWISKTSGGCRRMLEALILATAPMSRAELGEAGRLDHTTGTFSDYLSILRRNGLIDEDRSGIRIAELLR